MDELTIRFRVNSVGLVQVLSPRVPTGVVYGLILLAVERFYEAETKNRITLAGSFLRSLAQLN